MSDKTVLITGAALRIGAVIARELHAAGMNVIIHYLNSHQAAETLTADLNRHRPGSAWALAADLCDPEALPKLIDSAIACNGRLDALVNNASAFYATPLEQVNETNWDELIGVNLKAPLFLCKYAAEELRRRGGCIVNLGDIYGERPLHNYSLYSISKAGVVMLTRSMARELAPRVRVNAVSPGAVMWPDGMNEDAKERIIANTLLKRRGEPEDIARAVLYLILDADYVSGQVLTVDGGRLLNL